MYLDNTNKNILSYLTGIKHWKQYIIFQAREERL